MSTTQITTDGVVRSMMKGVAEAEIPVAGWELLHPQQ